MLRGVFLARQQEKSWLYDYGASEIMAEAWEEFVSVIPEDERDTLVEAFYRRFISDDESIRNEAARAWSMWEGHVATLLPNAALIEDFADPAKAVPMARIAAKFFLENFWLEEAQLLMNASRIADIPGIIVQGRHDICTPAVSAYDLAKVWPKGDLWIVDDATRWSGAPRPAAPALLRSGPTRHSRPACAGPDHPSA